MSPLTETVIIETPLMITTPIEELTAVDVAVQELVQAEDVGDTTDLTVETVVVEDQTPNSFQQNFEANPVGSVILVVVASAIVLLVLKGIWKSCTKTKAPVVVVAPVKVVKAKAKTKAKAKPKTTKKSKKSKSKSK